MPNLGISALYDKTTSTGVVFDSSAGNLLFRNTNIVLPKAEGRGIKVDDTGADWPFRDITGEIVTRGVGVTDPTWTQVGATVFYAYLFAVNDVCWISFHIPHDYVTDIDGAGTVSPIYLHTHWFPDGTDTNTVKWQYEYAYANGHNQEAFDFAGTTVTSEQAPPGTQYQHMVTETAAISVSGMEPDGILYVKMTRITNGGTDNSDNIFVLTLDVHYQSTNIGTKNRSPGFYT